MSAFNAIGALTWVWPAALYEVQFPGIEFTAEEKAALDSRAAIGIVFRLAAMINVFYGVYALIENGSIATLIIALIISVVFWIAVPTEPSSVINARIKMLEF